MGLDFAAAVLEIIAFLVIGNKCRWGFLVMFSASCLWLSYVLLAGQTYGLLLVVPVVMCVHIRNFIKWSREPKQRPRSTDLDIAP